MHDVSQLKTWRRGKRAELLQQRAHLPRAQWHLILKRVSEALRGTVTVPQGACFGFYWPFKGEIDLRALLAGADAALPVVV